MAGARSTYSTCARARGCAPSTSRPTKGRTASSGSPTGGSSRPPSAASRSTIVDTRAGDAVTRDPDRPAGHAHGRGVARPAPRLHRQHRLGHGQRDRPRRRAASCATSRSAARPEGIALSPDGRTLWVGDLEGARVQAFDAASFERLAEVATGAVPIRVAASPDGRWIVTSNLGDGTLTVIDARTRAVARTISGERRARGRARSPSSSPPTAAGSTPPRPGATRSPRSISRAAGCCGGSPPARRATGSRSRPEPTRAARSRALRTPRNVAKRPVTIPIEPLSFNLADARSAKSRKAFGGPEA